MYIAGADAVDLAEGSNRAPRGGQKSDHAVD